MEAELNQTSRRMEDYLMKPPEQLIEEYPIIEMIQESAVAYLKNNDKDFLFGLREKVDAVPPEEKDPFCIMGEGRIKNDYVFARYRLNQSKEQRNGWSIMIFKNLGKIGNEEDTLIIRRIVTLGEMFP